MSGSSVRANNTATLPRRSRRKASAEERRACDKRCIASLRKLNSYDFSSPKLQNLCFSIPDLHAVPLNSAGGTRLFRPTVQWFRWLAPVYTIVENALENWFTEA